MLPRNGAHQLPIGGSISRLLFARIDLVDVSDTLYFFCSGEGKGESEVPGRAGGFGFY